MKCLILAAGYATRLYPLTENFPKPLLKVGDRTILDWLVEQKGYPKGLLGNEIALKFGEKTLRCDSILYDKDAHPQMIIEYKAPTVAVTQRVFHQISAYNLLLHVDYLVVSNGLQHYCCRMDYEQQTYTFLPDIPDYALLANNR